MGMDKWAAGIYNIFLLFFFFIVFLFILLNLSLRAKLQRLTKDCLEFASSAVIPVETRADARVVVANSTARAVSAGFVAVSFQNIGAGWAFEQRAIGTSSSKIAYASYVFLCVPRGGICATSFNSKLLLSEANTSFAALIRADSSLAGDAIVIGKASALASFTITDTFIRAFYNWVSVVSVFDGSDPRGRFRASSA